MGAIAAEVAKRAVEFAKENPPIRYTTWDCQRAVEEFIRAAGGILEFRGSNDMARNAGRLWTLAEAKAQGRLVPGCMLFIWKADGEPARYRKDGKGNFDHVGVYVGKRALKDRDLKGRERWCDVVHSSASMGRVCGSTLANGWTHAMWFDCVDYGETAEVVRSGSAAVKAESLEAKAALLRRGSKGVEVAKLQVLLMAKGYELVRFGADGMFGAETLEAVQRFQRAAGLKVDGIVGPLTWAKLEA